MEPIKIKTDGQYEDFKSYDNAVLLVGMVDCTDCVEYKETVGSTLESLVEEGIEISQVVYDKEKKTGLPLQFKRDHSRYLKALKDSEKSEKPRDRSVNDNGEGSERIYRGLAVFPATILYEAGRIVAAFDFYQSRDSGAENHVAYLVERVNENFGLNLQRS